VVGVGVGVMAMVMVVVTVMVMVVVVVAAGVGNTLVKRAVSSVGKSRGLIILWSLVRTQHGLPNKPTVSLVLWTKGSFS
jgi:hypothetical protein